jgi:SNF2 family DNA or RNA helicase
MLDMLQARFKNRLTVLDKKGVAQDDWNAGKIEILAVQYQRGGAGLSLQHGGRSMCFIEPTYRADDYEQACARLGPLRQLQSGYQRTVNIFHVLARGTEDRRVFNVPKTKIELQDLVIEMLNAPA